MFLSEVFSHFVNPSFVLLVLLGSVLGLFVGSIPGLSVTMATALLVSITYTWTTEHALATIMGLYVVGVFSGALSAILINIPGAPSSVVTTFDGYPLAKKGESYKALKYATVYSFIGSLFGLVVLAFAAKPVSALALRFQPMDYFLLALFGLTTVGSLTSASFSKGILSAMAGLVVSMIGLDSVMGIPRMTFGIDGLQAGVATVPALVGLFGFSEVLISISDKSARADVAAIKPTVVRMKGVLKHFSHSLSYGAIGTVVGALPGAGGPVAAFLAYSSAKKMVKNPPVPFGEGAVEGIVASETANNACIGGALIPMLTLAVPGDAVTAVIMSVFSIHGLKLGPMFIVTQKEMFAAILSGGFLGCVFLLLLGLLIAPKLSRIILVPKKYLLPVVTILCVIGSFACNNNMFDVILMFFFGIVGFFMRRHGYPIAPMTLALVLGGMMDSNYRRAISLASSEEHKMAALFGRPITLILLILTILTVAVHIPAVRKFLAGKEGRSRG